MTLERLVQLEDRERELTALLERLQTELESLKGQGLANIHERIDGLCDLVDEMHRNMSKLLEEVNLEMRPALASLTDETEQSASHIQDRVARISLFVGKLKRERKARVEAERDVARWKRLARRIAVAGALTAAATIAATITSAVLHHCGVSVPVVPSEGPVT